MKWAELSYKRRSAIVIFSTLVVLFLAISFPIKRTLGTINSCNKLVDKINKAKDAPRDIEYLEMKLNSRTKNIIIADIGVDQIQIKILENVAKSCNLNEVELKKLYLFNENKQDEFSILDFELLLESNYSHLLKVLHYLEYELKYGRVVSVNFFKSKLKRKKNEVLQVQIYLRCVCKK
ncbi:hypothetical protein [Saccharicrinis aurantiacus]|uniref:hypothetical protein n=1 Tax=Saccharicrinis aurantiacus TaxID=1849719 RepID=UPI000838285C|nr:hypothetical protein [Saccharicrinis aurantiacus]